MAFPSVVYPSQMVLKNGNVVPFYSDPDCLPAHVASYRGTNGASMIVKQPNDISLFDNQRSPIQNKIKRSRRKRCLNCEGCRRTDNCGRCTVCTSPKLTSSNSICKSRRCHILQRRPSTPSLLSTAAITPVGSLPNELLSDDSNDGMANVSSCLPYQDSVLSYLQNGHSSPDSHSVTKSEESSHNVEFPSPELKKKRTTSTQPKPSMKVAPPCGCPGSDDGHYYTHLGAASSSETLRAMMEERLKVTSSELRMLELTYSGIEAKTSEGCPTAEWVVRRVSKQEKFLVLYRHHRGHTCDEAYTVVSTVFWDGVPEHRAKETYALLTNILPTYGQPTSRKCEKNDSKTCTCQLNMGNSESGGASYSFGCSWSVYYNGCKFARSKVPRKFRLNAIEKEEELEKKIQRLASEFGPVYKWLAPVAYSNQVATQESGRECRLGDGDEDEERPFSGMTCCMDFCAHSHYDKHNMTTGGATVVITILKSGVMDVESSYSSEQLHVLPLYHLKNPPTSTIPGVEVRPVIHEPNKNTISHFKPLNTPSTLTISHQKNFRKELLVDGLPSPCSTPDSNRDFSINSILSNRLTPLSSSSSTQCSPAVSNTPCTTSNFDQMKRKDESTPLPHLSNSINSHKNGFSTNGFKTGLSLNLSNNVINDSCSTDSDSDCFVVTDSPHIPGNIKVELPPTPTSTPPMAGPLSNGFIKSQPHLHPLNGHTPFSSSSELTKTEDMKLPQSLVNSPYPPSPEVEAAEALCHIRNNRLNAVPGGVAIALGHCSILVECAKKELHATTPIRTPCKKQPTRISMVFYQHKGLTRRLHGCHEEEEKQRMRQEEQLRRKFFEEEQQQHPHHQQRSLVQGRIFQVLSIPPTFRSPTSPNPTFNGLSRSLFSKCDIVLSSETASNENKEDGFGESEEFLQLLEGKGISLKVPKTIPLSEVHVEDAFYLELPLQKIDRNKEFSSPPLIPICYPCPLASVTTHSTTSVTVSSCKPQEKVSGNFANWDQMQSTYYI